MPALAEQTQEIANPNLSNDVRQEAPRVVRYARTVLKHFKHHVRIKCSYRVSGLIHLPQDWRRDRLLGRLLRSVSSAGVRATWRTYRL